MAAAIATRMQPSELERQHATIRVGMSPEEVARIMTGGEPEPPMYLWRPGFIWSWRQPRRFAAHDVRLEVEFDGSASVMRTTVDGVQVQP